MYCYNNYSKIVLTVLVLVLLNDLWGVNAYSGPAFKCAADDDGSVNGPCFVCTMKSTFCDWEKADKTQTDHRIEAGKTEITRSECANACEAEEKDGCCQYEIGENKCYFCESCNEGTHSNTFASGACKEKCSDGYYLDKDDCKKCDNEDTCILPTKYVKTKCSTKTKMECGDCKTADDCETNENFEKCTPNDPGNCKTKPSDCIALFVASTLLFLILY